VLNTQLIFMYAFFTKWSEKKRISFKFDSYFFDPAHKKSIINSKKG